LFLDKAIEMSVQTNSRKEFLKKLILGIGGVITPETVKSSSLEQEVLKLTDEQLDFLQEYEAWLKNFHEYVTKRNSAPFDIENNKKLMELSAEAEKRKPALEKFMLDPLFASYFNYITKETTGLI